MKNKFFAAVVSIILLLSGLMVITGGGIAESKEEEIRPKNKEHIVEYGVSKHDTTISEVDELRMYPSEHTYVMVGDAITVTATAWDNSLSEPVSDIELMFFYEGCENQGDAEFLTDPVVTTDENGEAHVTFDPGQEVGDHWEVLAENRTLGMFNHTGIIQVVQFRGDLAVYDESLDQWVGEYYYEEEPDVQIVEQALAKGGSSEFRVRMRNTGSVKDNLVFSWDNSSFPAGWGLEVATHDWDTWEEIDITEEGSYESELWPDDRRDFYFRVHSDPDADHEDVVSVNVSVLDSGGQGDNGTLEAYIPTPDVMWMSVGSKEEALDPDDGPPMPVSEYLAGLDLPPNMELPFWGVLYNSTIMSPVEIAEVTWTLNNEDGADASIDPESGSSSEGVWLNTGPSEGTVTLNASYEVEEEEYWFDEWTFNVTVGWDYVEITDEPDGEKVEDQDVEFADTMYLYAGVYNDTSGYVTTTSIGHWEYDSDMVNMIGVDEEHFAPEFQFVGVGKALVELNVMMPDLLLHDNVTFNISQPDVDSIRITDVPDGDWLWGEWVDVGQYIWFNVSAYNEELDLPVYLPDINVEDIEWEIDNHDNATGELEVIDGMAKVYSGRTGGRINLTASYYDESQDETFYSENEVHIHVSEPTVDEIAISYTPDGENKIESGTIAYGTNITGYACAYNNTIGFMELVDGYWYVENFGDVQSTTHPDHGNHSVFSAESEVVEGDSKWNLYYGEFSYSVDFDYLSVDWINITYSNGTVIEDGTEIAVGDSLEMFASAYNLTADQSIGFVSVSWELTNHNVAEASLYPTEDSLWTLLYAGSQPGEIEIEAGYGEMNDSLMVTIVPGELDSIRITPDDAEITADDTQQFEAVGYDAKGNEITGLTFTWEATNGTITEEGLFQPWSAEEVMINATSEDITGSVTIEIIPGAAVYITISPDEPQTVDPGEKVEFTAEAYDQYDNLITEDVTEFTWQNAENGVFSEEEPNNYEVTATYDGVTSPATTITVGEDVVEPSYIKISPSDETITARETQTYTAIAYDEDDNNIGDVTDDTEWSIEDGAGGNWDGNLYTSENVGNWTVTGKYDGLTDTATLIVEDIDEYEVKVGPVKDNAGDLVEGATVELSWTESDTMTMNAETDAEGIAVFTLNFDPSYTEFSYKVTHEELAEPKSGEFTGAESGEITIDIGEAPLDDEPGFLSNYWWLILLVLIIAVAVLVFMTKGGKKEPIVEEPDEKEDEELYKEEPEEELDEKQDNELEEELEEVDEELEEIDEELDKELEKELDEVDEELQEIEKDLEKLDEEEK